MSNKITYLELLGKVRDPEISDAELRKYFNVEKGSGGFDIRAVINTETVELSAADGELESAMKIGNSLGRLRHRIRYFNRASAFPERPTIVAEGDSWFQFPLLIDETVDHLFGSYNVWSLGAAGDTLANMVDGEGIGYGVEYLTELRRMGNKTKAFLFSGAGNDIIGEDPKTKLPMLAGLLKSYNRDPSDIHGHINHPELTRRLELLEKGYRRLIASVRAEKGFRNLPIILHGYDYPFPFPWGNNDKRNPIYTAKDQWLGRSFSGQKIQDDNLRRSILIHMIDRLYDMLNGLAGDSEASNIWVVDCRGTLPKLTDWADEIHGTSAGFAAVGKAFHATISKALSTRAVV